MTYAPITALKNFFKVKSDGTLDPEQPARPALALAPGLEVVFVDETLNYGGASDTFIDESMKAQLYGRAAIVLDVRNAVGKGVALCFKEPVRGGHTCDGLAPNGHGWWATADHLYLAKDHKAQELASENWRKKRDTAQALAASYVKADGGTP